MALERAINRSDASILFCIAPLMRCPQRVAVIAASSPKDPTQGGKPGRRLFHCSLRERFGFIAAAARSIAAIPPLFATCAAVGFGAGDDFRCCLQSAHNIGAESPATRLSVLPGNGFSPPCPQWLEERISSLCSKPNNRRKAPATPPKIRAFARSSTDPYSSARDRASKCHPASVSNQRRRAASRTTIEGMDSPIAACCKRTSVFGLLILLIVRLCLCF